MAKKLLGKIKLCPNTAAWSNVENNIFLSKARRKEMKIYEGCDMNIIMKAVESGMLEFIPEKEPVKAAQKAKAKVQEVKKKAKPKKEEVKIDVEVKDVNKDEPPKED